jgi:hypothetical protein
MSSSSTALKQLSSVPVQTPVLANNGNFTLGWIQWFQAMYNAVKATGGAIVVGGQTPTLSSAVSAAIAAGGGTIFTATPETFTSNPFPGAGSNPPIRIIFSTGIWKTTVPLVIGDACIVEGAGGGQVNGTNIQAVSGTFPINTPVITFGNSGNGIFNSRLVNINVDAQNIAGSTCVFSTELQENSGLRDVGLWNFTLYGANIDATSGSPVNPAAHYVIEKTSCLPSTSGSSASATIGLRIVGNAGDGPWAIRDISTVGANNYLAGLWLDNMQTGVFESLNVEGAQYGVQFGTLGINGISLRNVQTPSGTIGVDTVNFNGIGNQISLLGIYKGTCTNAISDSLRGVMLTDDFVPIYIVGNAEKIISFNPGISATII